MKAMIFAAGLGTRLRPLTNDKPKALVEYKGQPLLWHVISNLKKYGFNDIIINIHHFGDQIIDYLEKTDFPGVEIEISDERKELLDTGGGLYKARKFFDNEPFLVHNVDIITDLNLKKLYKFHQEHEPIASLAVRNNPSSRALLFSPNNILSGWKHLKTGETKISRQFPTYIQKAFSGIQIISPDIFNYMKPGRYSIIDTYLETAKHEIIRGLDHSGGQWKDMGKPESFKE